MKTQMTRLSGEDWQQWANKLLTCHYGPAEYQTVQDNDKGDAGIEGFTVSHGHAYQAYGCEEPVSTSDRYEKQRDKMTRDINKFINNHNVLIKIFGNVKISRWILLVPYYDSKEIVAHASKKTEEVVINNLPYVACDFHVMVCQEDDFFIERDKLINATSDSIKLMIDCATPEQVSQWTQSNASLAIVLDKKLKKLPTIKSEEHRHQFHSTVLKWYLEGQAMLDVLGKYPEVLDKVMTAKTHRENLLAIASISGNAPQEIFTSSIQQLKETLQKEVRELHSFSADTLACEAVADWLLRCPLDFPEVGQNV